MSNIIAKCAILFAGVIIAGAFLNLYILAGTLVIVPIAGTLGLGTQQVFTPLYWVCFAGGAVTSFFLMRPAWRGVGKKPATGNAKPSRVPNQDSN